MSAKNGSGSAATNNEARKVIVRTGKCDAASSKPNTLEDQEVLKAFLLGALRTAALRARLDLNEIESVGIALKAGWVDVPFALAWLSDIQLIQVVLPGDTGSEAA